MNIDDVSKEEIIKAAVALTLVAGSEFENEFPDLNEWCKIHATPEVQNNLLGSMISKIQDAEHVQISTDDFFTLYAYVQAVLGFQETKLRFPKLRSIALNLADEDRLDVLLQLVKQIERDIKAKHGRR